MNFWWDVLPPVLAALFIWWGATGAIIYLCGRKEWRPWVFGAVTALQPVAFWRLWVERDSSEVGGVFASFFWAVVIWAWIETSYYSGLVVGRRVPELEPEAPTGQRLRAAIAANLYHELSILALSVAVIVAGSGGRNEIGLWAFMILHWTHQSAKINIFLGVSNLTTEYLPDNLKYMAQYFSQKPLNMFFPFSVSITTVLATWLFWSTTAATSAGQQVGLALLFVMMTAAVIEHWWLVTPIPSRVWEWALRSRRDQAGPTLAPGAAAYLPAPHPRYPGQPQPAESSPVATSPATATSNPRIDIICGYLGSGKTTLIRHLLPQMDGRVAVVVNDFGSVGVDAELIRMQGAAGPVIELPGGCVCCTMQKNLAGQMLKLLDEYRPERILIEPSGVAGIEEIVRTLASPRLAGRLGPVEVIAVVDATRLLLPAGLKKFTLTQLKAAASIVISKIDLVSPAELAGIVQLVSSLNPPARIFPAIEGQVSASQIFNLALPVPGDSDHAGEAPAHSAGVIHNEEAGFISFAREFEGEFEPEALKKLYHDLAAGYFGPVERAKGIFTGPDGVRQAWDLAAGRVSYRLLPGGTAGNAGSRFMLVAADVAAEELSKRLHNCIIQPVSEKSS